MTTVDPYQSVRYDKPYLTDVIVRLDFISPETQFHEGLPSKLAKKAVSTFSIPEPKQTEITPASNITSWVFRAKNAKKRVTVSTHHLLFVYEQYDNFESLKTEICPIIEELFDSTTDLLGRRFGLRYINKIPGSDGDVTDWQDEVCEEHRAIFQVLPQYKDYLARAFQNLSWNYDDAVVNFNFGIHNKDHPAPIRDKTYIIDIDANYEGALEKEQTLRSLDVFHTRVQEVFESSITARLRERMVLVDDNQ